jgi:hypothetical protein
MQYLGAAQLQVRWFTRFPTIYINTVRDTETHVFSITAFWRNS